MQLCPGKPHAGGGAVEGTSEGLWEEVWTEAKSAHAQGREVCGAVGHHTETSVAEDWGQGSRDCRVSMGASRRGGQDHSGGGQESTGR